jgi:hypothetical protein
MAKKNSRSDIGSQARTPVPDRRRAARATTRSNVSTPDTVIAVPDGAAVPRDTANDIPRHGDGPTTNPPTYEEIAEAAYLRYLGRGGQHGNDLDDWIDAERSLRSRL